MPRPFSPLLLLMSNAFSFFLLFLGVFVPLSLSGARLERAVVRAVALSPFLPKPSSLSALSCIERLCGALAPRLRACPLFFSSLVFYRGPLLATSLPLLWRLFFCLVFLLISLPPPPQEPHACLSPPHPQHFSPKAIGRRGKRKAHTKKAPNPKEQRGTQEMRGKNRVCAGFLFGPLPVVHIALE